MDALAALQSTMAEGGTVMWALLLMALVAWYAMGFRSSVLWPRREAPAHLVRRAREGLLSEAGHVLERAAWLGQREVRGSHGSARDRVALQVSSVQWELGRYRATLRAVVGVAPVLGLLGTVTGMIETFESLGSMTLFTQSGGIAGGIAQALLTTQFGLAIAIPGLIVGKLLERREAAMGEQLIEIRELLLAEEGRT